MARYSTQDLVDAHGLQERLKSKIVTFEDVKLFRRMKDRQKAYDEILDLPSNILEHVNCRSSDIPIPPEDKAE